MSVPQLSLHVGHLFLLCACYIMGSIDSLYILFILGNHSEFVNFSPTLFSYYNRCYSISLYTKCLFWDYIHVYLWKPVPADVDGCEDCCGMERLFHHSYTQTVTPFGTCLCQGCLSCTGMVVCPCCHSEITKFALVPFLLVLAIYLAIAPS